MTLGLPPDLVMSLRARLESDKPCDFSLPGQPRPAKPLTPRQLAEIERSLGFGLPTAVRDLYGRIANGGFGPGYGLIGLVDGVKSDLKTDVVEDYALRLQADEEDPGYFWPSGVLPVCHWGCAVYSCVDCRASDAAVLRFDPNPVDEDWSIAWGQEAESLMTWLGRWMAGEELFESGTPDGSFTIER